jgi:hypothetical protein
MIPLTVPTMFLQAGKRGNQLRRTDRISDGKSISKMAHPARLERANCGFEDCKCIAGPALDAALNAKDADFVNPTSGSFRSCLVSCGAVVKDTVKDKTHPI